MGGRILIVEDEEDLAEAVAWNLGNLGYDVVTVATGEEAIEELSTRAPALVLLDWMLPDMDGIEVCRWIRRSRALSDLPVIMATARGAEIDRVVGFEVGVDDYVVKPYSIREVELRVRAILRRVRDVQPSIGACVLELDNFRAVVNGEPVMLTLHEVAVLRVLSERKGGVVSRQELLEAVWSDSSASLQALESQLKRLRNKLGDAGTYLETVRGAGVRLATG